MFWRTHGAVIAWLIGGGLVVGALLLLLVFGLLIPPDRGEEIAMVIVPLYGAFFGGVTGVAASLVYGASMMLWTRREDRSIASRAWVGALSAATGALAFWLVFGLALTGPVGIAVWGGIGAASAAVVIMVAGPLTARAARRTDSAASRARRAADRSEGLA